MRYTDYDVRVGAYAVLVRQGHVLLALWNEQSRKRWTMPGGGAEFGESAEQTAIREVLEETGYQITIDRLLGLNDHWISASQRLSDPGRPMRSLRVIYQGSITAGRLTNEVDGSTDEARWVPLTQVHALDRVDLVDEAIDLWRTATPLGS